MNPVDLTVLGLGSVLLKDDGIGVYLVRELQKVCSLPGVKVYEIGTAVFQIPLLPGIENNILVVDALLGGGEPGTVYRLNAGDIQGNKNSAGIVSLHDFRLIDLLNMPQMAGRVRVCRIFGVEPGEIDFGLTLTPALNHKLPNLVQSLHAGVLDMITGRQANDGHFPRFEY